MRNIADEVNQNRRHTMARRLMLMLAAAGSTHLLHSRQLCHVYRMTSASSQNAGNNGCPSEEITFTVTSENNNVNSIAFVTNVQVSQSHVTVNKTIIISFCAELLPL